MLAFGVNVLLVTICFETSWQTIDNSVKRLNFIELELAKINSPFPNVSQKTFLPIPILAILSMAKKKNWKKAVYVLNKVCFSKILVYI